MGRGRSPGKLFPWRVGAAFEADAEQFEAVINQTIAKAFGDLALQRFQFGIDKFDDLAGFHVDHVIVVGLGRRFIAGATVAEIMAVKDAGFFEQPNGSIDRGNGNARIDGGGAFMQPVDIGMVKAVRKHPRDDATLFGYPEAPLVAERFNVERMLHV